MEDLLRPGKRSAIPVAGLPTDTTKTGWRELPAGKEGIYIVADLTIPLSSAGQKRSIWCIVRRGQIRSFAGAAWRQES